MDMAKLVGGVGEGVFRVSFALLLLVELRQRGIGTGLYTDRGGASLGGGVKADR